ncbi:MAG: segregation/condensation protein A [Chitinophagales bacterium]|nr:segregation/condensation protein A [Chitinophagales bacterium]
MSDTNIYKISLPQFEGPFDLLLFFIERDELDIQDIPIHQITEDFLDYIRSLEEMKIEVASEFILVAATLMSIKTKMLIPRKELNEDGEEIDPREELIQKLLEYKRYKSVLQNLELMEEERSKFFSRGGVENEQKEILEIFDNDIELEPVSLYRLYKSFQKVLEDLKDRNQKIEHRVVPYNHTIEEEKEKLFDRISIKNLCYFEEVFEECTTKIHAVFVFLAILEMVQQHYFNIEVGEGYNSLLLRAS